MKKKMATKRYETKSHKRFNGLKWAENMYQNGRKDEILEYTQQIRPTCEDFMKGVKDYVSHVETYKDVLCLRGNHG